MHSQPEVDATSDKESVVIIYYNSIERGIEVMRAYLMMKTRIWPVAFFYYINNVTGVMLCMA